MYSVGLSESSASVCYSGIPHWMYTVGIRSESDMYSLSLSLELTSVLLLIVSLMHIKVEEGSLSWLSLLTLPNRLYGSPLRELILSSTDYRMNYHVGFIVGASSALWFSHLIYVVAPISRGTTPRLSYSFIGDFVSGGWVQYSNNSDAQYHIHCSSIGSGSSLLTFKGGIGSSAIPIPLTDITHHHLALGILLIWASHSSSSTYKSVGQKTQSTYRVYGSPAVFGLTQTLPRSIEFELSTSLVFVSQASSFTSQHLYSLSPYAYLSSDYVTLVALLSHHTWVASSCMLGGSVHRTLFLIRDYRSYT